ncbi:hypothetical protein NE237_025445 [Protea cynaroides]|uniref:Uncharacterized protein n=1 Tax=Protea cynaroides TaxID=273540 RepID=A0A9Q0H356_9MAGN|nr:hypothetical protein NE237_025445 [Protea cynaroides]
MVMTKTLRRCIRSRILMPLVKDLVPAVMPKREKIQGLPQKEKSQVRYQSRFLCQEKRHSYVKLKMKHCRRVLELLQKWESFIEVNKLVEGFRMGLMLVITFV